MMRVLFLELLNRSIAAGWLIVVILLLRILLRRFPRWIFCLMWGIVGIRLILPFLFESSLSLIPSVQTIEPSFDLGRMIVQTGIEKIDVPVNMYLDRQFDAAVVIPKVWYDTTMQICSRIWGVGAALLFVYNVVAEIQLRRKVRASLCCGGNVYICDDIASPFVLGVLRPRIYLPSVMGHTQTRNVLLHERAHIARLDPLWKVLGSILLCVYWINPLMWIAYIFFSRDIELACDERVIRTMDSVEKREYAHVLLHCSIRHRMVAISPVAFGAVGVKKRIRSIVWFKKSSDRTMAAALLICAVLTIGFLSNPADSTGYDAFADVQGLGPVFITPRCACANRQYEYGEYFYAQDGELVTECEFCNHPRFHVHERGTVKHVGYCATCGEVFFADTLYEGYQCLSRDGKFVKTK